MTNQSAIVISCMHNFFANSKIGHKQVLLKKSSDKESITQVENEPDTLSDAFTGLIYNGVEVEAKEYQKSEFFVFIWQVYGNPKRNDVSPKKCSRGAYIDLEI